MRLRRLASDEMVKRKAIDGAFLYPQTLGIHNLQYLPPFWLLQHFNQCLVAFFNFLLLLRKLGRGIEANVEVF